MRLLIFTPTYELHEGLALAEECRASIEAQEISAEWEHRIGLHNPFPVGPDNRNVLAQYQKIREDFLREDWDAVLFVEHDNVLPDEQAAQRMIDTPQADVVYAPYLFRHGSNVITTLQYCGPRNVGQSLSLHPYELMQARRAGTWRVSGLGFGCTLIWRHVIERLPMRSDRESRSFPPDTPFAQDALAAGFVSMGRFDVPVLHLDRENNKRLHPYGVEHMGEYIAIVSVNVLVNGHSMRLKVGETYRFDEEDAQHMVRAGYVQPVLNAPPPVERAVLESDGEMEVLPVQKVKRGKGK